MNRGRKPEVTRNKQKSSSPPGESTRDTRTAVELGFFTAQGLRTLSLFEVDTWTPPFLPSLPFHVQSVSKSYQLQLQNPFRIPPFLITSTATTLAQATTSSHLDNSKNLLSPSCSQSHIPPKSPSQSIFHTAVRETFITWQKRTVTCLLSVSLLKGKSPKVKAWVSVHCLYAQRLEQCQHIYN